MVTCTIEAQVIIHNLHVSLQDLHQLYLLVVSCLLEMQSLRVNPVMTNNAEMPHAGWFSPVVLCGKMLHIFAVTPQTAV